MTAIVSVRDLKKSYGKCHALNEVSFDVEEGEIFGVIGADGAGKTTLFRILTTLLLADSGTATVDGLDVVKDYRSIRKNIGYMPGKFSLYPDLNVEENLNFFATMFNVAVDENYQLIKDIYCQIEPFKNRKAGKLSGGMKQKLALSCALIHSPKVLFLDEPTTGVDPVSRKEFWEMLKSLKNHGITILVSTPYMDEASMCDRIVLIQNGAIMKVDTPEHIVGEYKKRLLAVRSDDMHRLLSDLREFREMSSAFSFGEYIHVTVDSGLQISALKEYLEERGHKNIVISEIAPTIEDCFMLLMRNGDGQ